MTAPSDKEPGSPAQHPPAPEDPTPARAPAQNSTRWCPRHRYNQYIPGTRNVTIVLEEPAIAPKTTPTAAALADAFAALSVEGKPVTVRALRERAGVSTDAAAAWLRTNRPARDVPPVPTEALARVLEPLWSAAITAARDEHSESDASERAALVQAETDALTEVAAATSRAESAEAEVAQLRREVADLTNRLAAAEAARDQQAGLAAAATREAIDAREAAHKAELSATEAQATARTLREILNGMTTGTKRDGATL